MFFEPLDVEKVLIAPSGALVGKEVSTGEDRRLLIGEGGSDALGPRFLELDTIDGSDDVNPNGFDTDLEDETGPGNKTVRGERMGADDEKLNATRVEFG
jgi:hypothetical protein